MKLDYLPLRLVWYPFVWILLFELKCVFLLLSFYLESVFYNLLVSNILVDFLYCDCFYKALQSRLTGMSAKALNTFLFNLSRLAWFCLPAHLSPWQQICPPGSSSPWTVLSLGRCTPGQSRLLGSEELPPEAGLIGISVEQTVQEGKRFFFFFFVCLLGKMANQSQRKNPVSDRWMCQRESCKMSTVLLVRERISG